MNISLLIQYILLALVLAGSVIYIIIGINKHRKSPGDCSSCTGCKLKDACNSAKNDTKKNIKSKNK